MLRFGWYATVAVVTLSATAARANDAGSPSRGAANDVGEIIVTAQKRSESVQRVPLSISAVSGTVLAQQGVKDLFQAVTLVPGVVFSRAPDDGLALTFRGMGTTARPQAFEQSVALFTDGVFLGKGRLYSTSFFDVDRMEFIKGSLSTLLGKNASFGAISVITRQPGDVVGLELRGGYEVENGGYTVDGAADLPLGEKLALRVAGHDNDLNGQVRNDVTGRHGPQRKDLGLRATLKATLGETLTVTASYQHADNRQYGAGYQLIGNVPAFYGEGALDGRTRQSTSLTSNGDTLHITRSDIASLKAEVELGDHRLVAQTTYVTYALAFRDDFDFSVDDSVNFLRDERYRQFTQELRLESPSGGKLDYMVGLFYLDSRWNSVEMQDWAVPGFPPAGGPPPRQLFNGPFTNSFVQNSKAYSGFASGTWHLSDELRLAGGIRYTREEKDVVYARVALAPFTVWNTIANPQFDPTALTHRSGFLDGNVSLEYDIAPRTMIYASLGHGSKAGGFVETNTIAIPPSLLENGKVPPALVAAGAQIRDEFATTYEIGMKSAILDGRLHLNLAGFWTDVRDFQDTVFTGGTLGFITFNGPARTRGFELESAFQVTPSWRFDAAATYADATAVIQPIDPATSAPQVDVNGNLVIGRFRRSQAPQLVFNFGTTYTMGLSDRIGLNLGGALRHRSAMFNQRQDQFLSKALTTLDLSLGLESRDKHWGVDLVARNVGNSIAEDFASPSVDPRFGAFYGAYLAGPSPSRTILLSAWMKY